MKREQQIITVQYHQGEVLNRSDNNLIRLIESDWSIITATPIISNGNTVSVVYVLDKWKPYSFPLISDSEIIISPNIQPSESKKEGGKSFWKTIFG